MKQRSLMNRIFTCALMLAAGMLILLRPSGAWAKTPEEPIDIVLVVETIHAEDGSLYGEDLNYREGNHEYRGEGATLSISNYEAQAMPGETVQVTLRVRNGYTLQKLVWGSGDDIARGAGTDIMDQKKFVMWDQDEKVWIKAVVRDRLPTEPRKITVVCSTFDANGVHLEEEGGIAEADKQEAVVGEEVHITATPAKGFVLQRILWGTGAEIGENITKTGTFKMWDDYADVVVDVLFEKDKGDARDLSSAAVTGIVDKVYTGKEITQNPVVTLDGTKLKKDTDYTISYSNNIYAGTARMLILGKGGYVGKIQKTFKIKPASIKKATVTGLSSSAWTGKAIRKKLVIQLANQTLNPITDYSLSYSNNKNVGRAEILITGTGNYTGKLKKYFKILPQGTVITSIKGRVKQLTVQWKQQSRKMSETRITGYQLSCSREKDFSKDVKTVRIKGYKPTSLTMKTLKNQVYYFRIRTYKTVDGVNYYSAWSGLKKKELKK